MNDNQNYFVQAGRTTSRVSRQPGGNCSIMIGGWTEEELKRQREKEQAQSQKPEENIVDEKENSVSKEKEDEKKIVEEKVEKPKAAVAPADETSENEHRPLSSNAFASGANMNSCNVLTDRPTSRVSAPPGGHCSIRLG